MAFQCVRFPLYLHFGIRARSLGIATVEVTSLFSALNRTSVRMRKDYEFRRHARRIDILVRYGFFGLGAD